MTGSAHLGRVGVAGRGPGAAAQDTHGCRTASVGVIRKRGEALGIAAIASRL